MRPTFTIALSLTLLIGGIWTVLHGLSVAGCLLAGLGAGVGLASLEER